MTRKQKAETAQALAAILRAPDAGSKTEAMGIYLSMLIEASSEFRLDLLDALEALSARNETKKVA